MMTQDSAEEFAAWLAQNEPSLFSALEREAATVGARLNGISDFLSTIGSSLSAGVSNVAKFITSDEGLKSITGLGAAYMTTKAQSNVLSTQLALAQSGMMPAAIQNTIGPNGQIIPVYSPTNQPVNSALLNQLQPSLLSQLALPIGLGVAALVIIMALRK